MTNKDTKNQCGRCGYDLSGIVESWGTEHACQHGAACPLEGVCSECGWEFAWRDVFNAWRLDKPWLIEHARTKRQALRRIPRTAWRVTVPWKFWGGLSMQARVRPWFAACVLLFVLAPVHLGVNGHETYSVIRDEIGFFSNYGAQRGFGPAPFDRTAVGPIIASVAGAPAVRPTVNNVWMAVPPSNANPSSGRVGQPVRTRRFQASPPGTPSTLGLIKTAIAIPWWFVAAGSMIAAWIVLLAVLPTTRALTKLRWAHVARSAVYSTAGVVVLVEAARLLTYHTPSGTYELELPVFVAMAVWLTVWWVCAVTLGWKMKHGLAVAAMLGATALLAGLTAGLLFDDTMLIGVL